MWGSTSPGVTVPPPASSTANRSSRSPRPGGASADRPRPDAERSGRPSRRPRAPFGPRRRPGEAPVDLALVGAHPRTAGHRHDLAGTGRRASPAGRRRRGRPDRGGGSCARAGISPGRRLGGREPQLEGHHRVEFPQLQERPRPPRAAPRPGARAGHVDVVRDVEEGGERAPARSAPTRGARRRPRPPPPGRSPRPATAGVARKSRRFIETWARVASGSPRSGSATKNPLAWTFGQPAAGFADAPGDPLGELDVVRVEVDVPGDEERPGADGHRPRPTGASGPDRNRARGRAGAISAFSALVLAATDVGELHPIGRVAPPGRRGRRAGRTAPRSGRRSAGPARPPRPSSCRRAARTGRRRPRRSAGARPSARPCRSRGRPPRRAPRGRRETGAGRPGDGQHGAVVAGVARPVEEVDAGDRRDRAGEPVDDVEPSPLGDVRDRFDQAVGEVVGERAHRGHRATAGRSARPADAPPGRLRVQSID